MLREILDSSEKECQADQKSSIEGFLESFQESFSESARESTTLLPKCDRETLNYENAAVNITNRERDEFAHFHILRVASFLNKV